VGPRRLAAREEGRVQPLRPAQLLRTYAEIPVGEAARGGAEGNDRERQEGVPEERAAEKEFGELCRRVCLEFEVPDSAETDAEEVEEELGRDIVVEYKDKQVGNGGGRVDLEAVEVRS